MLSAKGVLAGIRSLMKHHNTVPHHSMTSPHSYAVAHYPVFPITQLPIEPIGQSPKHSMTKIPQGGGGGNTMWTNLEITNLSIISQDHAGVLFAFSIINLSLATNGPLTWGYGLPVGTPPPRIGHAWTSPGLLTQPCPWRKNLPNSYGPVQHSVFS